MRPRHFAPTAFGFVALLSLAPSAFALPLANAVDAAAPKIAPSAAELASTTVDFTAIVALNNCSGSLVRFTTSQPTDYAMVLTIGHCYEGGFIEAGDALLNVNSTRTFRLLNSAGNQTLATLRASRIIYATMTGTDITLYRLNTTFANIQSRYGVEALTISEQRPAMSTPISIASGYWRRIYSCNVDNFVYSLHEGDWIFTDSIRYSSPGCETIGGTSGSPILNSDTREVIGINNTGNEDGERCTLNNPCEVDESGNVVVNEGASYGQQTFWLYACLNDANEFDLEQPDCQLQHPARR